MSSRISLRLAIATLAAASVFPLTAFGQSQDQPADSVAEAARRTREQKKAAAAKQPAPVITDDTLKPSAPPAPEANAPAPAPTNGAPPAAQSSANSANRSNASAGSAQAGQ